MARSPGAEPSARPMAAKTTKTTAQAVAVVESSRIRPSTRPPPAAHRGVSEIRGAGGRCTGGCLAVEDPWAGERGGVCADPARPRLLKCLRDPSESHLSGPPRPVDVTETVLARLHKLCQLESNELPKGVLKGGWIETGGGGWASGSCVGGTGRLRSGDSRSAGGRRRDARGPRSACGPAGPQHRSALPTSGYLDDGRGEPDTLFETVRAPNESITATSYQ